MTETKIELSQGTPTRIGWYATCHSWDANEGGFFGTHHWNGWYWDEGDSHSGSISFYDYAFPSWREAVAFANEHWEELSF